MRRSVAYLALHFMRLPREIFDSRDRLALSQAGYRKSWIVYTKRPFLRLLKHTPTLSESNTLQYCNREKDIRGFISIKEVTSPNFTNFSSISQNLHMEFSLTPKGIRDDAPAGIPLLKKSRASLQPFPAELPHKNRIPLLVNTIT